MSINRWERAKTVISYEKLMCVKLLFFEKESIIIQREGETRNQEEEEERKGVRASALQEDQMANRW